MELFDTHAHLNAEQFEEDVAGVITRAEAQFVKHILVIGTTLADSERAVEIATEFPQVYAAVGIQPNYVSEADPGDFAKIEQLARHDEVIAIGETGLDRYWDRAPFSLQQDYFHRHIELSLELDKPFVVHMRECGADILDSLRRFDNIEKFRGIMHSFTGDEDLARACLDCGLHISFAGMLTYKKSDELRKVAASIPINKLLVETDSPYLSPHPKRAQRPNEPALVIHTAECLAEQQGLTLEEMAAATTANAKKLFGLVD